MLNQLKLVGRLMEEPIIEEKENGEQITIVTLGVSRSYKNVNGEYDIDFIKCILWEPIAKKVIEFCKVGNVLGIKGKLECLRGKELQVIAEKVTFLTSKKRGEME